MSNREKYDAAFMEVFEIGQDQPTSSLEYQSITAWDSVGHMALVAALEEVFDIMLEMDDIIDFGSYETGIKTMQKYGVAFRCSGSLDPESKTITPSLLMIRAN